MESRPPRSAGACARCGARRVLIPNVDGRFEIAVAQRAVPDVERLEGCDRVAEVGAVDFVRKFHKLANGRLEIGRVAAFTVITAKSLVDLDGSIRPAKIVFGVEIGVGAAGGVDDRAAGGVEKFCASAAFGAEAVFVFAVALFVVVSVRSFAKFHCFDPLSLCVDWFD